MQARRSINHRHYGFTRTFVPLGPSYDPLADRRKQVEETEEDPSQQEQAASPEEKESIELR